MPRRLAWQAAEQEAYLRSSALICGYHMFCRAQELSTELGARPDWRWGGEQTRLEALKKFGLDLVVGGFDSSTPWSKDVGLTRPYYMERFLIGAPPGTPAPRSLKGLPVVVGR